MLHISTVLEEGHYENSFVTSVQRSHLEYYMKTFLHGMQRQAEPA